MFDFTTIFIDVDLRVPKDCGEVSCELKASDCLSSISSTTRFEMSSKFPYYLTIQSDIK